MNSPSIRAAVTRVAAGSVLLFSLASLVVYWQSMLVTRPLSSFLADPWGMAVSVATTAMLVGVSVATFGLVTETFDRNRRGYLRAMRVCGAVGVVAVGVLLLLSVVTAL